MSRFDRPFAEGSGERRRGEHVPGGGLHWLKSSEFHGALLRQLTLRVSVVFLYGIAHANGVGA
jgi:hypothetical protein